MRYLISTLNYLKIITLSNPTHMIIMADPLAINIETPVIDRRCYLLKEFTELICINS